MNNVDETLNSILIQVYRSLLQYAGECWPWAAAGDTAVDQAVRTIAEEELTLAGRIFAHLDARGWPIDLGGYPDNSSLHYVSLTFLLQRLVADHQRLVTELNTAASGLSADLDAARLVADVAAVARRNLEHLRKLTGAKERREVAA